MNYRDTGFSLDSIKRAEDLKQNKDKETLA